MYVCMYVRNRLAIEIYVVYVPFGTWRSGCHRAMAWGLRLRTRRIEDEARMSPDVWKMVNCSTKG